MGATWRAGLAAILVAAVGGPAFGAGSEGFGDEPIHGVRLAAGLKAVADLKGRAYWSEINGDFRCHFRGDADAANRALKRFREAGGRDVILWPAAGRYETFQTEGGPCDFALHVPGGLGLAMLQGAKTEGGTPVFEVDPTLTIYLGDALKLDALAIPDGLRIVELGDLRDRYAAGVKGGGKATVAGSKDVGERAERTKAATVRAQSAVQLGTLAPIADEVLPALRAALRDPESYVRLCAIDALGRLGTKAALPDLEAAEAAARDDRERDAAKKAIADVRLAKAEPTDAVRGRIKAIHALRANRR